MPENKFGLWECVCDCGDKIQKTGKQLTVINYRKYCHKKCKITSIHYITFERGQKIALNNIYASYAYSSKTRGYLPLPKKDWISIASQPCVYCGDIDVKVKIYKGSKRFLDKETVDKYTVKINGIDRIDSKLGYTVENSCSCCGMCNTMKLDHTLENFLAKVKLIHDYRNLSNIKSPPL